jgi:hypothetical protein
MVVAFDLCAACIFLSEDRHRFQEGSFIDSHSQPETSLLNQTWRRLAAWRSSESVHSYDFQIVRHLTLLFA